MRISRTTISSILKVFQLGLGCLSRNLIAVMSCRGTRLSDEEMTIKSCDPPSQWGSGMRSRLGMLTTQSARDLALVTVRRVVGDITAKHIVGKPVLTVPTDLDPLSGLDSAQSGQAEALSKRGKNN